MIIRIKKLKDQKKNDFFLNLIFFMFLICFNTFDIKNKLKNIILKYFQTKTL